MRAFVLLILLLMSTSVSATDAPVAPPAPGSCAGTAHRQFDFWLGEWVVTGKAGKIAGHSRIEAILGACVIAEHWSSASGKGDGKSFNLYNRQSGQWEQFWVDGQGTRLLLSGGLVDGRMVLSGRQLKPDAATGLVQQERISWTPNGDGSVRQLWESSRDGGKTWAVVFDGMYRRRAAQ
ncbi:MAG: hypothetical protein WC213_01105 [Arenimonas sp.]|jgi:hypothetical protein